MRRLYSLDIRRPAAGAPRWELGTWESGSRPVLAEVLAFWQEAVGCSHCFWETALTSQ